MEKGIDQWVQKGEELFRQAEQWLRQQPVENLYVALAAVVLTSLLFVLLSCSKRTKSNTIILAGLSGSGKTTLFYQLRDGSSHQGTVTSMEPNNDIFILHSEADKNGKPRPVRMVDVPGHSRLRPKIDDYLPQAAGLIFVVDALDFLPNCRAAAEYLYDILTKASVVKKKIPILIVCNKTDKVTAHSKDFIRKQLEKELDKLRLGLSSVWHLYLESMSETNSRLLQAGGSSVSRAELICPRPRRATSVPFVLDSLTRFGPRAKGLPVRKGNHGFEILDGILTKDELEGDSDASNQFGFLCGSPPVRTSNPVVKDVEFAKLALLSSSPLGSSLGMKPSRHDKGPPSCGSPLGTSPKVRIEGFVCGSPESGRVVPAIA